MAQEVYFPPHPPKSLYKTFQCDLQGTPPPQPPTRPSCVPTTQTAQLQPSARRVQSHLWPSTAAMAFCGAPPCWAPGGHVGCGWWRWWKLWAVGEEGGIQVAWWLGGDEAQKGLKFAGGEQATAVMGLLVLCRPSDARSLENMARASGKLGGVAGVLLGVHICSERHRCREGCPLGPSPSLTAWPQGPWWGSPRQPPFTPSCSPKAASTAQSAPLAQANKNKKIRTHRPSSPNPGVFPGAQEC